MQTAQIDDWLNKAFKLAFFIHGRRDIVKQIAASAMNKLETASNAQFKRYYYTPTGRAETSRATRSRVSLNDLQLLQRLVFVESENFEKQNETAKTTSEKNLLVYFIKHLVRISLKRNSFYVTLGISRILHNYGTNDAMEIYNIVVQDPDRVHDDYYRSRKGVLMKELKARDISGDEVFDSQIREQISAEFLKNKSLTIVPKEKAEARLILYVRRESDAENPENDTALAIVRLVNSEGFVIYPNRKRVTGWKYLGQTVDLPKRIVRDLISAKANSKAVKK